MHLPWRLVVLFITGIAFGSGGCINTSKIQDASDTSSAFSSANTSNTAVCSLFSNNSKDFSTCLSCASALGSGASDNAIVECVHTNVKAVGGPCIIPTCGTGQVVDFATCSCQSAASNNPINTQPGFDDQLTPYMHIGFFVGTYYCNPSALDASSLPWNCIDAISTLSSDAQKYLTLPPANVFQDIGCIRWDLALDASQYGPGESLSGLIPFLGTFSTLIGSHTFEYNLKPNTALSGNTIKWQDCAEHFSGSISAPTSTNHFCNARSAGIQPAPAASTVNLTQTTATTGTAVIDRLSMNGTSANKNLINGSGSAPTDSSGNPIALFEMGLLKTSTDNAVAYTTPGGGIGPGLLSNIGYYKYSWGPLAVTNPSGNTVSSSGTISSTTAVVTNLGFSPVSAVESTAFSPAAAGNTVQSRTCSDASDPCVITVLYRTSGGAVAMQNYSPRYGQTHASAASSLPTGIGAVGTPKVIEDTSQFANTANSLPARLRAFARSADGNIYMSLGNRQAWGGWVNLGRPWVCSRASGGSSTACLAAVTSSPRSYEAYVEDSTNIDQIQENDGISIAGEPMVYSFMDASTADATHGTQGYIVILVRVSQVKSSDGTLGKYHNAVFYNYARTTTTNLATAATTSFDFDALANWSGWMPIRDAAGAGNADVGGNTIFRIQGDPIGTIVKVGGNVRIHVFGTQLDNGAGAATLHPPIGPAFADTGKNPSNALGTTGYYNYGNAIIRTSRTISVAVPSAGAATPNDFSHAFQWDNITHDSRTGYGNNGGPPNRSGGAAGSNAIVGNLSATTDGNTLFVLANELFEAAYSTGGSTTTPGEFTRFLSVFRYDLSAASPSEIIAAGESNQGTGQGQNFWETGANRTNDTLTPHGGGFLGAPQAITLSLGTPSALDGVSNADVSAADKIAVFGRATCPANASGAFPCDRAVPSIAYLRFDEGGKDNAGEMYFSGETQNFNATAALPVPQNTFSSTIMLRPTSPTSDVVPVLSHSLSLAGADVPVYLFYRERNGNLTMGRFLRFNSGASGIALWDFLITGGFLN